MHKLTVILSRLEEIVTNTSNDYVRSTDVAIVSGDSNITVMQLGLTDQVSNRRSALSGAF